MRTIDIKDPKHARYLMNVYGIASKLTIWTVDADEGSECYMLMFSQMFEKKAKNYSISSRNEIIIDIGAVEAEEDDDGIIAIAKSYAQQTYFNAKLYRKYAKEKYEKL